MFHEVDGIQEEDNRLPRWWLWGLYATIAFALVYWFVFHVFHLAPTPVEAYQHELAYASAHRAAALTPEQVLALAQDPDRVARGRTIFTTTCSACHRPDGGGQIGPNLTDGYWLHGGHPDQILHTVTTGWPDKGMPAWGSQLGKDKVQDVVAYVLTIKGTNVPNGKEPQGEPE